MGFQFDISLRRIALLQYALLLWKRKEIRIKLKQFYYPYARLDKMKWLDKIIEEVIEKIDRESIPKDLYMELVKVVKDVAYKQYDFFHFLKRRKIFRDQSRRQIYEKFCNDIHWTHFGTVDAVKTIRFSWMTIPNVDMTKIFIMASCFCMEDVISDVWENIHKSETISYRKMCKWSGFHLAAYWYKLKESKINDFVNDVIIPSADSGGIYESNKSVEINMLKWSVHKGLTSPVKYFWMKLSEEEKKENLDWCLTQSLSRYKEKWRDEHYRRDQFTEIIFFLMDFLNEELRIEIFSRELSVSGKFGNVKLILEIAIEYWPWQNFLKPLISKFRSFFDEKMYEWLIKKLFDNLAGECCHFQNLIQEIWNILTNQFVTMQGSLSKMAVWEQIQFKLFDIWNLRIMKLMINDDKFKGIRSDLVQKYHPQLVSLIRKNEIDKLSEFINEILILPTWTENIQESFKSLYRCLIKCDINSADEVIKPYPGIKCKINVEIMYYYFLIRKEYELADKFLSWKLFKNDNNVKKFKERFKKDDFIMDQIHNFWLVSKENVNLAIENSDNFLLWLFRTKKGIDAFKSSTILPKVKGSSCRGYISGKFNYHSWVHFVDDDHFDILEDFLRWCSLNDEGIKKFKDSVFKNDLDSIYLDFVRNGRFEELKKICKWTFDSKDEMFDHFKDWLVESDDDDGIYRCQLFISKCCLKNAFDPKPTNDELKVQFKNFIKFLKGLLGDLDDFKKSLEDWPENSRKTFHESDSDDPSTVTEHYSDYSDWELEPPAYCDVDNYNLFLSVLNEEEK